MKTEKETRFCIVGAGPSGLVAGDTLRKLGYSNITLLEKNPTRVGGKCHTLEKDSVPLELGAVYVFPHYPVVNQYIEEVNCHLIEALPFVFVEEDGKTRPYGTPRSPLSFTSRMGETLRMGYQIFFKYNKALKPPLGEVDPRIMDDLSMPTVEWIKKHNLRMFHEASFPLMRSFGFGYEEHNVSAIYNFQVLMLMAHKGKLLSLMDVSRFKMYHVKEGYGELWRRVAEPLHVELGVHIQKITRNEKGVVVTSDKGEQQFDKLILACDLKSILDRIDATEEEKELFGSAEGFGVWTAHFRARGIDSGCILEDRQGFDHHGYGMAGLRYNLDSDWIYFFGYTNDRIKEQDIVTSMKNDLKNQMGAEMLSEPEFEYWHGYCPHFDHQKVRAGYHARLELLQGQNHTYLTGELLANNGVEWAAAHAKNLVGRHFA